jgi:flagellar protein FliS
MTSPARTYRESVVRGASPVGLVVILYEEVIRSISRAQRALRENNIEQRTLAFTHAIDVIGYLHAILNFEQGGKVARHLALFYTTMQSKIFEANLRPTTEAVEWLAAEFTKVAEAWQEVDRVVSRSASETSSAFSGAASARETSLEPMADVGR